MSSFAKGASGDRSRDKCVIERTGGAANTDRPVGSGSYFKVHEDQPKDIDNTEGRQDYTCPDADIIPLTDDRAMLTSKVDGYRASGSTGGHLGLQWAWNLIAEDWASFWGGDSRPDPYAKTEGDRPELIKAVILMTDGVFNTSFFNGTRRRRRRHFVRPCGIKTCSCFQSPSAIRRHKPSARCRTARRPAANTTPMPAARPISTRLCRSLPES